MMWYTNVPKFGPTPYNASLISTRHGAKKKASINYKTIFLPFSWVYSVGLSRSMCTRGYIYVYMYYIYNTIAYTYLPTMGGKCKIVCVVIWGWHRAAVDWCPALCGGCDQCSNGACTGKIKYASVINITTSTQGTHKPLRRPCRCAVSLAKNASKFIPATTVAAGQGRWGGRHGEDEDWL